ncbi:recombinase family protein [Vibrio sp. V37_P2S8PM304]|uniref:recombinase family protein n=1 Tax=Vibrio sp. V37_P2S8PM304 TaxID=1938688 RepID=UPI00137293B9|nr:recombinase family protein [Vibrio sp. V37_P2S8PM304]
MKYGYAVQDNDLSMQLHALSKFECDVIDKDSELFEIIERLKPGDVLVVWRLDKLTKEVSTIEGILSRVHQAGASLELLFEKLNSGSDYKQVLSQLIDAMSKIEKL